MTDSALKLVQETPAEEKPERLAYMLKLAHDRGQHTVAAIEITDTAGGMSSKYRVEFS